MRRVLLVLLLMLAACSSKTTVTTAKPSGTPAVEPNTPAELKAFAQVHFNSFSEGDFGTFWDDFDSDAKHFISRDEYVRRLTACMQYDPNKYTPFRVASVVDNKDGTWTVSVLYSKYELKFPARYESGHWRFGLAPDAKAALRLPMAQYLATKCAQKPAK
jgi:hypothetical protein